MICIDTNILIHATKAAAGLDDGTEEERDLRARCLQLLTSEIVDTMDVVVPTVVVAEFLGRYEGAEAHRYARDLARRYKVVPLDLAVATVAAEIGIPSAEERAELGYDRRHFRVLIGERVELPDLPALVPSQASFLGNKSRHSDVDRADDL